MLSIGSMGEHSAKYYMGLATEDYYLDGGEPPGVWHGRGAAELGLTGTVEKRAFYAIFYGASPESGELLVRKQPDRAHHPGWDLTFSAPKSVSVLWSQTDEDTRHKIQELHFQAVQKSLTYLENNALITRRGAGGHEREPVHLVSTVFEHGTSRAQDPQLHSHALVFNVGTRDDGTTGAIHGTLMYRYKMAAGALYRAELAVLLQRELHLTVEQDGSAFAVSGISKRLVREFSKRRQQIENALKSRGLESAQAAAMVTIETRAVKEHVARQELFGQWQSIGSEYGVARDILSHIMQPLDMLPRAFDTHHAQQQAVATAIERLTAGHSYFTERALIRYTAEEAQWRGVGIDGTLEAVREGLGDQEQIVYVGTINDESVYTTPEMLALEAEMLARAERLRHDSSHTTGRFVTTLVELADRTSLSDEQKNAFQHITRDVGAIKCVDGMAGTGKTTLLKSARDAWEAFGYEVIGATISAKAAHGLQEESGIRSMTVAQLLSNLDPTLFDLAKHHHRQFGRALMGKPTYKVDESFLTLNSKIILVIDEAVMVGTRQLARIIEYVEKAGAKLVLVGDRKQLQAIEAGGAFGALCDKLGCAKMTDIRRQRDKWAREAVRAFAEGEVEKSLQAYSDHGMVTVANDREEASTGLISSWKVKGVRKPQQHIIFTATRQEADALNRAAQQERLDAGRLGSLHVSLKGTTFYSNDRVLFMKNSRSLGLENGTMGTILFVEPLTHNLIVLLDDGRTVGVPLLRYQDISLGYAITTHKGQGATVENAYILMGGAMQDREMSYVQLSRARGDTHIFVDKHEAGPELQGLIKQMETSHEKKLAHTVGDQEEEQSRQAETSYGQER